MSDAIDLFRRLRVKLQNLVQRGVITRSGTRYQGVHMGGRVADDLENFQPQGIHFRVPFNAEYIQVHPAAEMANAVMLGAHVRQTLPTDDIPEGTGGLHYLGEFAVYVDDSSVVHLGGGTEAADFVALAAFVDARIEALRVAFNAHTHTVSAVVTNATPAVPGPVTAAGTAAIPSALAAQDSVAADKVKAT